MCDEDLLPVSQVVDHDLVKIAVCGGGSLPYAQSDNGSGFGVHTSADIRADDQTLTSVMPAPCLIAIPVITIEPTVRVSLAT
jgi:hypothetical protein